MNIHATALTLFVFAMSAGAATAQVAPHFRGDWTVTWQAQASAQQAKLVLTESGGKWQTQNRARNNPCVGREVPVVVQSASDDEVSLKLDFESVIPGCPNGQVTLRRVDDKTISGRRGNAELVLVRN
jgi:hypothetical protein